MENNKKKIILVSISMIALFAAGLILGANYGANMLMKLAANGGPVVDTISKIDSDTKNNGKATGISDKIDDTTSTKIPKNFDEKELKKILNDAYGKDENVPQNEDIAFGYTNESGDKIIVTEEIKNPGNMKYIWSGGYESYNIEYLGRQQATKNDDSRDTSRNFNNRPGELYKIRDHKLNGSTTYMIYNDSYKKKYDLYNIRKTSVSTDDIARIEKSKNRKVLNVWTMGMIRENEKFLVVEFEPWGNYCLASIAYIRPDKVIFVDFPAEYNDISTWRVDDNGKFDGSYISLLSAGGYDNGVEFSISWSGAEGESINMYTLKDGKFIETKNAYRYWSPM